MLQSEPRLRIVCGAGTLALALTLCWIFEVIFEAPGNQLLTNCCQAWRALQFIPYVTATVIAAPAEGIDLLAFWLLFTLQWFIFGTVVISRMTSYVISVIDLIRNQSASQTSYKVFDV